MNQRNGLQLACDEMDAFEAGESQANTGTGARGEGNEFEELVSRFWVEVAVVAKQRGATFGERYAQVVGVGRNRRTAVHQRLSHSGRSVFLPRPAEEVSSGVSSEPRTKEWLSLAFSVSKMAEAFPGRESAITQYAPQQGKYAANNYWNMFDGLTTTFDDTVVFENDGVLIEKHLLEYKTGKSSKGGGIDGNAHERLSYQLLQYLEIATRFTSCRFEVITNGAFRNYRNKYHLGFNQQAERLRNFKWFSMTYRCESVAYEALATEILDWLFAAPTARDAR